jgi:hypothetical protein
VVAVESVAMLDAGSCAAHSLVVVGERQHSVVDDDAGCIRNFGIGGVAADGDKSAVVGCIYSIVLAGSGDEHHRRHKSIGIGGRALDDPAHEPIGGLFASSSPALAISRAKGEVMS